MYHYKYIVIGSSAAGISALNTIARIDPTALILCVSESIDIPYNTCFLVDVLAGKKSKDAIALRILSKNVHFMLGKKVIAINRAQKIIVLSDNSEVLYQKLLIATGVQPYLPSFAATAAAGIFTFHTLSDLRAITAWIDHKKVQKVIILGGGLTGLECADALHTRGIMVTIIEKNNRLLERHLSVMGALFLQKNLKNVGVELVFNASLERMVHKDGGVHAIVLANGKEITTDIIIIAAGVQPNSALAHMAGLELHRNYVMVNEYMQTSDGAIYAAGDVAIVHDQTIGILAPTTTWIDAAQQGMIAAHTMTGIAKPYTGTVSLINSHFFGLYFASMAIEGHAERTEHNRQEYIVKELKYIHALVRDDVLLGFHYIGDNSTEIASLRRAIALKKNINDLISLW